MPFGGSFLLSATKQGLGDVTAVNLQYEMWEKLEDCESPGSMLQMWENPVKCRSDLSYKTIANIKFWYFSFIRNSCFARDLDDVIALSLNL